MKIFKRYVYFDYLQGPAEIDLKRIEKCGDDALGAKSYFLRHKVNRTHQGTDVNMSFPFPIDETVTVSIKILLEKYFCLTIQIIYYRYAF